MSTLSKREVSLSDHIKRRRSSAALSNYIGAGSGSSDQRGGGGNSSVDGHCPSKAVAPQHHHHLDSSRNSRGGGRVAANPIIRGNNASSYRVTSSVEGGYDSHAASYGNYDAPSYHCRSYGASEHGCYAAESYITSSSSSGGGGRKSGRGRIVPPSRRSFSDPLDDLEGQRSEDEMMPRCSRQRDDHDPRTRRRAVPLPSLSSKINSGHGDAEFRTSRFSQASTAPMGPIPPQLDQGSTISSHWEDESSCGYYPKSSFSKNDGQSVTGSASTASTAASSASNTSSSSSSSNSVLEEEAIRQGIIDISTLIATYLAGALSFIIVIFLTLLSPFVKVVKLIVGDVRGLLGDAGFLQELGSLWNVYRELRRRGGRSSSRGDDDRARNRRGGRSHGYHDRDRYYDDEQTEAESTLYGDRSVYSDQSPQYVGGWQPHIMSGGGGSRVSINSSSSRNSKSQSSLPMVYEDQYRDQQPRNAGSRMYPPQGRGQPLPQPASYHPSQPPPSYYPSSHQPPPAYGRSFSQEYGSYHPSSPMQRQRPSVTAAAVANSYSPQKKRVSRSRSGVV